jgi:S1-C subfamily serine protease
MGAIHTTGSGCIIKGSKILTNAHVVADNIAIQVQLAGDPKKYKAEAKYIDDIADIALLEVNSPEFIRKSQPLELGDIPNTLDEIQVYGFPVGGDEMSITKGVVSRFEFDYYSHSGVPLLLGQIDAAVNPGNSGGPVIKNGKRVGVIMQGNMKAQNTNFFIPTNVIKHFLKDIEDGSFDGIPDDLFLWQTTENPSLREYLNLNDSLTGGLVTKILPESPLNGILKINDIVLSVDHVDIDNDCKVVFRPGERTEANYILYEKYINDSLEYQVYRDGTIKNLKIKLTKKVGDGYIVPLYEYNKQPCYFIIGGLVFQPLTYNLNEVYKFGSNVKKYLDKESSKELKEIVILSQILESDLSEGYSTNGEIIISVNSITISSMESLIQAFENNKSMYHVIETDDGAKFILNRELVENNNQSILQKHGITSDRSENLKTKR